MVCNVSNAGADPAKNLTYALRPDVSRFGRGLGVVWAWYAHCRIGIEVRGLRTTPLDPSPTTRVLDTPVNP